ncbi:MAG: hypothetical protein FJ260_10935 [Planctomycetes bacterium]|nr:hypothetical protein [Planctomycetota bacterium]
MKRAFVFATSAMAVVSASADAGVIGFAAFSRIASNGNRVIDVVAVMQNANDRLLNVYGADLRNNAGAGGASFFTQQAGAATRGWKPDAASSTRSSIVDSFCTIGVEGGSPYEGQYYAAGAAGADGGFSTGPWKTPGFRDPFGDPIAPSALAVAVAFRSARLVPFTRCAPQCRWRTQHTEQ